MKHTAQAPANIAFIKYWGKQDEKLRTPLNSSFSMNLSGAFTITTVEFSSIYLKDEVILLDGTFSQKEIDRVIKTLNVIRQKTGIQQCAKVMTQNTFPKGAGAAASASGFAALTIAGFAAAGGSFSEKELTIFARMGSGSACRSIPDGFVFWEKGESSDTSYAYTLFDHTYWDLRDILLIVDAQMKKVSTTDGMEYVATSPKLPVRLKAIPHRIEQILQAFKEKNFQKFGEITEEDCLDMHAVMQSQIPPLLYWNQTTKNIMEAVKTWRKKGLPVYFTIDAGPNVHILCEAAYEKQVIAEIQKLPGITSMIVNTPAMGAHSINTHLF